MYSAILLLCSLEMNQCKTIVNPGLYGDLNLCLQSLALGFTAAEEAGWTVMNYTCLNWETKELKINPDELLEEG